MGAWIEIYKSLLTMRIFSRSHPTMGAWIEINNLTTLYVNIMSHPTMGAWIEIMPPLADT